MRTRWTQVVKLGLLRSLQAKATLLVIAIVAGVLALSTFFNVRVSERALERDLRDHAIALARQFAADINSWEELNSPEQLQAMIDQVMEPRSSIVGVEVYAVTEGVLTLITSRDEKVSDGPSPEVSQVVLKNRPVAVLREELGGRQWDVAAPVHIGGVFGGVHHL